MGALGLSNRLDVTWNRSVQLTRLVVLAIVMPMGVGMGILGGELIRNSDAETLSRSVDLGS